MTHSFHSQERKSGGYHRQWRRELYSFKRNKANSMPNIARAAITKKLLRQFMPSISQIVAQPVAGAKETDQFYRTIEMK